MIKENSDIDYFKQIEQEFYNFRKTIDLTKDISPINLKEEKSRFIECLNKGQVTNPIFKYEKTENINKIGVLQKFRDKFEMLNHSFSKFYIKKINREIDWIINFGKRDVNFEEWLSFLYGMPSNNEIESAKCLIKEVCPIIDDAIPRFSPTCVKKKLEDVIINHYGFHNWDIVIESMVAKMAVNHLRRKIRINENVQFTENEINRLIIHEIGTHVLRGENGQKQYYLLFQYGFPDYLETEEGLAIYSEEKNNLRRDSDIMKYCIRLLACDLCHKMSFSDLFQYINQYFDIDTSFDVSVRIKRGLIDTSEFGGYTKDQVYYNGYLKVRELSKDILKKLYIGKVGISDLDFLSSRNITIQEYLIPDWVK